MPGIQISSLQDLLTLRAIKEQNDPFRSGIQALATGVQSGIETAREEAKAKKKQEEALATQLQGEKAAENTFSGKFQKSITVGPKGRTASYAPLKTADTKDNLTLQKDIAKLGFQTTISENGVVRDKTNREMLNDLASKSKEISLQDQDLRLRIEERLAKFAASDEEVAKNNEFTNDLNSKELSGRQLLEKYSTDPDKQEAILSQIKLKMIPLDKQTIKRESDIDGSAEEFNVGGTKIPSAAETPIPSSSDSVVTQQVSEDPFTGVKSTVKNLAGLEKVKKQEDRLILSDKLKTEQTTREETFRSIQAGINLTGMSYGDAVASGKAVIDNVTKPFGFDLDPSRGLEGKAFSWINQAVGNVGWNPLFGAFEKGMAIELAPELAKASDKGVRLGKQIIEAFRKTIPTLVNSTTGEGAEQLALSGANAFRKEAAKLRDDDGEFVYDRDELDAAVNEFKVGLTDKIYKNLIAVGAYVPETEVFNIDGVKYEIPDYMIPSFRREMGGR